MSELAAATTETPVALTRNNWADMAGMIASIGCAIHCAAMPLVLAYLPAFGLSWLADDGFHKWMAAVCFALAAAAFVPGWRKHGSFVPTILGATGVLMLNTAAFGMECDCCPSGDLQQSTATLSSAVLCEDRDCKFCTVEHVALERVTEPSTSIAWLSPFATSLGGLLLVLGHAANHQKSCHCRGNACCVEAVQEEQSHVSDR